MADEPRDYSREAAHRRYEKAQDIAAENPDVGLNEALGELYWNTEWEPGIPTHQEVQDNWDYYAALTNNGQIPLAEAIKNQWQQEGGQVDYSAPSQVTDENNRKTASKNVASDIKNTDVSGSSQEQTEKSVSPEVLKQDVKSAVDRILSATPSVSSLQQTGNQQERQGNNIEPQETVEANSSVVVPNNLMSPESKSGEDDSGNKLMPSIERSESSSYNDLSKLQKELQEDQQRKLEQGRDIYKQQLLGQYGSLGLSYDDPLLQQELKSADTMTELPHSTQEVQRRVLDNNGNVMMNPLDWNILGFTSQQKTSDAGKNLYEAYFNSDEYKNGEKERSPYIDYSKAEKAKADSDWMVNASLDNLLENPESANSMALGKSSLNYLNSGIDPKLIDDGVRSEAREGPYMTGDQYLRYREEAGIPGRDVELINPNALYNKQDEMVNYGFIPYVVTDEGLNNIHDDAAANAVNNIFNGIADIRRNAAGDYTYDYEGNSYSGKDFENRYVPWFTKMAQASETSEVFTDPSKVTEDSIPLTLVAIDDVTGEQLRPPANATRAEFKLDEQTGLPVLDFGTGNEDDNWYFSSEDDTNNVSYDIAKDGEFTTAWQDLPPLVLGNGQKLRADKALDLSANKESYANYGPGNWKKPQIEEDEVLQDANGNFTLNPLQNNFVPWITDIALGSAPLFWGPTAAAQAMGNTWSNLHGFSPGSQNSNGEYRLLSAVNENDPKNKRNLTGPTGAQMLTAASASAALPATERLWGSIAGKEAITRFPFIKQLAKTHPEIAEHPFVQWLAGTLGEGLEEIPGNLVEEAQATGSFLGGDYFANPLYYDENGNFTTSSILSNGENAIPVTDAYGRQLRDKNTNLIDRNANFWKEAPASVGGGAALGGVFSSIDTIRNRGQYRNMMDERRQLGYNLVVPEAVKRYNETHKPY